MCPNGFIDVRHFTIAHIHYLSLTKPSMMSLAWTSMISTELNFFLSLPVSCDLTCRDNRNVTCSATFFSNTITSLRMIQNFIAVGAALAGWAKAKAFLLHLYSLLMTNITT